MNGKSKTIQERHEFKEGLYFNMSDEDYFKIPCLSASGLKKLKSNPSKFWWDSWMNPDKEYKDTDAKILGRAFHKRILEGEGEFNKSYVQELVCDDGDVLKTATDIKEFLKEHKHAHDSIKLNAKKESLIEQALKIDPDLAIYDVDKQRYEAEHEGKIFLSEWAMRRIELCAKVIESHPLLKTAFIGGFPEVTCVWFDGDLGVWFKCRYDYLKVSAINDLKTFTRMGGKEIERFLPEHITQYAYNIQATHYLESMKFAKKFAKEGRVFGYEGSEAWLNAFAARPCEQFHFVFQQKEEVPNAYEAIYSTQHGMHEASKAMIRHAAEEFKTYSERHGDEMWPEIKPAQVLTDDSYPPWAF